MLTKPGAAAASLERAGGLSRANIYSFHPLIAIDGSKDLSLYYNSYPKQFNPSCQTDTHKLPAGIGIKTFICFSELSEYFLSITKQKGNQDNSAERTRTWRILHRSPTECFGKILWCFTTTFVRNLEEEHSYLIEDFLVISKARGKPWYFPWQLPGGGDTGVIQADWIQD